LVSKLPCGLIRTETTHAQRLQSALWEKLRQKVTELYDIFPREINYMELSPRPKACKGLAVNDMNCVSRCPSRTNESLFGPSICVPCLDHNIYRELELRWTTITRNKLSPITNSLRILL
jgi:hypothetical protein